MREISDTEASLPAATPDAAPYATGPAVSVLLAAHGRPRLLRRALASVAAQTLPVEAFEVVVVVNGPPEESPDVVREARDLREGLQVRLVECRRPGVAHARQVGLWAARGEHVTILDDDDWISPGYLEALLSQASPGVVPLAWLAEVDSIDEGDPGAALDGEPGTDDRENYYSESLVRAQERGGGDLVVERLLNAVVLNVCKLVPTALARATRYDHELESASDVTYWTRFFAENPLRFRLPVDPDAVYVRTRTAGSLSRRGFGWEFNVERRLDCLEALGRIPTPTAREDTLVRRIAAAQCRLVRDYLAEHPEDRTKVADVAQRRGVRLLDWRVVNEGAATGLAILYAFSPWNSTSGLVAARRVRERGRVLDVVCNNLGGAREMDPSSTVIADPWVADQRVVEFDASFSSWEAIAAFSEGTFAHLADMGDPDHYEVVYSRATWAASHLVAAQYKLRHPGVRWIAEMSDPLSRTIKGGVRPQFMRPGPIVKELRRGLTDAGVEAPEGLKTFEWAERLPYGLADEIIFTNPNQLEFMMSYLDDEALVARVRSIATIAPHPTLPRHLYDTEPSDYPLPQDRVNLAYFGVFYATRGLVEITGGLGVLPRAVRDRIRLHVFTNRPDEVAEEVAEAGLDDVIAVNPYRPYMEFLYLTTTFDVLVVNDSDTSDTHDVANPYLPSKVSDYRGSGTPIWGIYDPGSILSGLDVAHRTPLRDVGAAVELMTGLVRARFGSEVVDADQDAGDALAGAAVPEGRGGPHLGAIRRKDADGGVGQ